MMAMPGTLPPSAESKRISRRVRIAWANVPTKRPIATWLVVSWRIVRTIRGENCPIANCTTTIVIVRTSAASVTMDVATVLRMIRAASGPPVSSRGIRSGPSQRSTAMVPIEQHAREHGEGRHQPETGAGPPGSAETEHHRPVPAGRLGNHACALGPSQGARGRSVQWVKDPESGLNQGLK